MKSGYQLAMSDGVEGIEEYKGGNSKFFKALWNLKIQNKIKIFIWKALHVILPTRFHLASRGVSTALMCPLCSEFPEHSFHPLWLCSCIKSVWTQSSLWHILAR